MRGRSLIALATTLAGLVATQGMAGARGKNAGNSRAAAHSAVIVPGPERTAVDWSRGLITAVGAAAGDLRAPSPAVARVAAKRKALDQARARLERRARELTVGTTPVAKHIETSAPARARLERALRHIIELDVHYGSDGSVVVTAGLPLEAVRLAVHGPARPGPAGPSTLATAVIVDARKVMNTPLLGVAVNTPAGPRAAATVFHRSLAAARADPRLGDRAVEVTAAGLDPATAVLDLAKTSKNKRIQSLDRALETGALVVIVLGK